LENEKIVETVAQHTVEIENIKDDIKDLKDTQKMMYEMNTNIKLLVEKIGTTNTEISGIKKDIGDLRCDMDEVKNKSDRKDAKKWDKLIWIIIGAVVMAILGTAFKQIGI